MFVITVREDNRVLAIGKTLDYMDNDYPRLVEEDVAFPKEMVNVYEVIKIPEGVAPEKYCYTEEQGFYLNSDWIELDPNNVYGIPDKTYHAIIDDYNLSLIEGGIL